MLKILSLYANCIILQILCLLFCCLKYRQNRLNYAVNLFNGQTIGDSVFIATCPPCGLDIRSSISGRGKIISSTTSKPALGPTQPPTQWAPRALSPGMKRTEGEHIHSRPSSAEVKNGGTMPLLPAISSWHSAQLIKQRDKFIFTPFLPRPSCVTFTAYTS
jgi:hypothetical protein